MILTGDQYLDIYIKCGHKYINHIYNIYVATTVVQEKNYNWCAIIASNSSTSILPS
jgi:hypothetical protein